LIFTIRYVPLEGMRLCMKNNNFEQMQQDLQRMRDNLNNMQGIDYVEKPKPKFRKKGKRVAKKNISKVQHPRLLKIAKDEKIIVIATIVIVAITCIFSTTIFAKSISDTGVEVKAISVETEDIKQSEEVKAEEIVQQEENEEQEVVFESNENAIELENILVENMSVLKSKEYVQEMRPIEAEVQYVENPNLPEGEEVVIQEGESGAQQVTVIKSYENNEFVGETILNTVPIKNTTPKVIEVGISKFLANNKVHLDDTMYLRENVELKTETNNDSDTIYTIPKSIDVTLVELINEEWCKINFDGLSGYVECKKLTSSIVTPGIVEASRVQRIKMTVSEDMQLNKSTNLTLEDYQRILKGNRQDKNNVIADNAEAFYNADKKYNMNGVFLASIAIHESAWGTSTIANNKKNLFGYGAYDSSPYSSSFSFDTYADGIDVVAKALVKYYLNPQGTPIGDGEVAKASYYTEPTVASVNTRYASDQNWHKKVFSYMEFLYNRL